MFEVLRAFPPAHQPHSRVPWARSERGSTGSSDLPPWSAADLGAAWTAAHMRTSRGPPLPEQDEGAFLSIARPRMTKAGMCAGAGGRVAPGSTLIPADHWDGHVEGQASACGKVAGRATCTRPQADARCQHAGMVHSSRGNVHLRAYGQM